MKFLIIFGVVVFALLSGIAAGKYFQERLKVSTPNENGVPMIFKRLGEVLEPSSPSSKVAKITNKSDPNLINLQTVSNVGYTFYLGQVDKLDTPPISDNLKNDITQVIYKSKVPKTLLNNVAIIIVNTLVATPDIKIVTPHGQTSLPDFPPVFLTGGGLYSKNFSQMSLIFINSRMVAEAPTEVTSELGEFGNQLVAASRMDFLSDTLTHELAHFVGSQLTTAEWVEYYKLRNISTDTPLKTQTWETSPSEDFAEVYKNTVIGSDVRTYYGLLEPKYSEARECEDISSKLRNDFSNNLHKIYPDINQYLDNYFKELDEFNKTLVYNQQIQDCRRDVSVHAETTNDIGPLYVSLVDQPTKNFINEIIARLD